jgi:Mrp family chromosome partitioning ATPase
MRSPRSAKPPKPPKLVKSGRRLAEPTVDWLAPSGYRFAGDRMPVAFNEPGASHFIELATLLTIGHVARGRRGLAVCGAAVGVGVSFVAANLAAAIAMGGTPTRLVETNLRLPCLSEAIRPPTPGPGLSDFLLDEGLSARDVIGPEVIPELSVVFAGTRPAEAVDLLASDRFAQFAEACLRDSELTIFDTPPANRAVDARVVARAAGYALIVARRGRSFYDDVAMLSAQLAQDGVVVVGTILNRG